MGSCKIQNQHKKQSKHLFHKRKRPVEVTTHQYTPQNIHYQPIIKREKFHAQNEANNNHQFSYQRQSDLKKFYLNDLPSFFQDSTVQQNLCLRLISALQSSYQNADNMVSSFYHQDIWFKNIHQLELLSFIDLVQNVLAPNANFYILQTNNKHFLFKGYQGKESNLDNLSLINLSFQQAQILKKRAFFMEIQAAKQIKTKQIKNNKKITLIDNQLRYIYKILASNDKILARQMKRISQKMINQNKERYSQQSQFQTQYTRLLINKNLQIGFKNKQNSEEIQYFQKSQYNQQFPYKKLQKITNQNHWKRYIQTRRPKKNKLSNYKLLTACSACFSNYYQSYNPLIYCTKCCKRYHKLCVNNQKQCSYCLYQRLSLQKKKTTKQCYLCQKQGLMTMKINKRLYIHNFCMLVHKLWTIKNRISYNQKVEQESLSEQKSQKCCSECKKQTILNVVCLKCKKQFHATCAYFSGFKFSFNEQKQIIIDCCSKIMETGNGGENLN